jgi:hypothetical protein
MKIRKTETLYLSQDERWLLIHDYRGSYSTPESNRYALRKSEERINNHGENKGENVKKPGHVPCVVIDRVMDGWMDDGLLA